MALDLNELPTVAITAFHQKHLRIAVLNNTHTQQLALILWHCDSIQGNFGKLRRASGFNRQGEELLQN